MMTAPVRFPSGNIHEMPAHYVNTCLQMRSGQAGYNDMMTLTPDDIEGWHLLRSIGTHIWTVVAVDPYAKEPSLPEPETILENFRV